MDLIQITQLIKDGNIQAILDDNILHIAVENNNLEITKMLIENKININITDKYFNTPLHISTKNDNIEISKLLLDNGARQNIPNFKSYYPLHYAIENNNINMINLLLDKHADINCIDLLGNSPLHISVKLNNINLIKHLIENNADINITNNLNLSPLCYSSDLNITKYLIEKGARINPNALINAVKNNRFDHLVYLIKHGGDVNAKDDDNCNLLMLAIVQLNFKMVRFLIDKNADVESRNSKGSLIQASKGSLIQASKGSLIQASKGNNAIDISMTSCVRIVKYLFKKRTIDIKLYIHKAVLNKQCKIVKYLITIGGKDVQNEDGDTPLHIAVRNKHIKMIRLLMYKNADFNILNKKNVSAIMLALNTNIDIVKRIAVIEPYIKNKGMNLLHYAVYFNQLEITKQLLTEENINSETKDKNTPLHIAICKENYEIASLLIDKGADVNKLNKNNKSPLCLAIGWNSMDIIKKLIEKGVDAKKALFSGHRSAIMECIEKKNIEMFTYFVNLGVDINMPDEDGKTPLHEAVCWDRMDMVKVLIENGALRNVKDRYHRVPFHYAVMHNQIEMVKYLIDEENINLSDRQLNPLHIAVKEKYVNMVKFLVSNNADVNASNNLGNTPLHMAVKVKHFDIVKFLISNNANINAINKIGDTPLHIAVKEKDYDIVKLLVSNNADVNFMDDSWNTPLHILLKNYDALNQNDSKIVRFLVNNNADIDLLNNYGFTPLDYAEELGLEYLMFKEQPSSYVDTDDICKVCRDVFENEERVLERKKVLYCNHVFCVDCIERLEQYNTTNCPSCRSEIYGYM